MRKATVVRRDLDEHAAARREDAANRALYAVDPDLARSLGYHPRSYRPAKLLAARHLPRVLVPGLTRRPQEQLALLRGSHRMIGASLRSIGAPGGGFGTLALDIAS
ncbi:MAG: hypothetical protein ACREMA_04845 [Longimicrobiales bacterium]